MKLRSLLFFPIILSVNICLSQTVIDYDSNVYNTVIIGSQIWMQENLKVTHYRNGDPIPNVVNATTWSNLTSGARCYYNNDSTNHANLYGHLYNWYTVGDNRGLCPAGWHIPTQAELETLIDYLGGNSVAGGKMKETGLSRWNNPNTGATNSSKFTGVGSGNRGETGSFYSKGGFGQIWSSTSATSTARGITMYYNMSSVHGGWTNKKFGFAVRCLCDSTVVPSPKAGYNEPGCLGNPLILNAMNITNASYAWTGPNGFSSNQQNPVVSPSAASSMSGVYKVVATVSGRSSLPDSVLVTINEMPIADFNVDVTAQCFTGNLFTFTNKSAIAAGSMNCQWQFGDGSISLLDSVTHTYKDENNYTVRLVAQSNGCADTMEKTVYVHPVPAVSFSINDTAQCLNGNSFVFSNTSSIKTGLFESNWSFGDGNISTNKNAVHSFSIYDTFTVKLSLTSDFNCSDSISKVVIVKASPDVSFTVNDTAQCFNNQFFIFTNTSGISVGSLSYKWYLGDGNSNQAEDSFSHIYAKDGNYIVRLVATSDLTCMDSVEQSLFVHPMPVVYLGADTTLKDNQQITLDAGAGMDDYLWSDGSKNSLLNIDTTTYGLGTFTIWVKVSKNSCESYDSIKITFVKTSGIESININKFSVFPNPATDKLYINRSDKQTITVQIFNMLGKCVLNTELQNSENEIDISYLNKGIYFLKITDGKETFEKKVIKK